MEDPSELLRIKAFWFFYQLGEDYQLDKNVVKRFAAPKNENKRYDPVIIHLECAPPYALGVEIEFDMCAINLFLLNRQLDKRSELGWWDEARWHPFALRWEELEKLLRYWEDHPAHCSFGTARALLLLARFVGNGVDESDEFAARRDRVRAAYHELALFSPAEVEQLVEATLLKPLDDDYRWTRDPTLGWVFGGDYPCYSIRNAQHADGAEGRFPFADWDRLIAAI